MEKYYLDPNILLGKVICKNENEEVVHLSLKKGNEVPEYENKARIILIVLKGEVLLTTIEEVVLKENEMVILPSQCRHKIDAVDDSQLIAIKCF